MIPSQRLPFTPLPGRPPLKLPGDARVVVWPVVNVEVWDIMRAMPRQVLPPPTHVTQLPDFAHWAWHEYGMRVGFWRIKQALDELDVRASLFVNGRVCEDYEPVARAALDAGWEFVGHGYDQRPTHQELDQRAMIQKTVRILREYTGRQPVGWLAPGLTETLDTPDLLAEAGIRYIADWVVDDEPCEVATRHGKVLAMPYSVELNDIPMMMVQHHAAGEFVSRCMDYFDRVYEEGGSRAKVMAIAVHPYISGVPHRIKYFETVFRELRKRPGVLFWTGEQLLDWYWKSREASPAGR